MNLPHNEDISYFDLLSDQICTLSSASAEREAVKTVWSQLGLERAAPPAHCRPQPPWLVTATRATKEWCQLSLTYT